MAMMRKINPLVSFNSLVSLNIFSLSLLIMNKSEIFYKVKCNNTKNKISDKKLRVLD